MRIVTFFGETLLLFSKIALASFEIKSPRPLYHYQETERALKFLFDLLLVFTEILFNWKMLQQIDEE